MIDLMEFFQYKNLTPNRCMRFAGTKVVFGKVTAGMDVVDKIEAVGSQSGATAQPVIVKDCGEL